MIEVVVVWLLAGVLIGYFMGQRDALKPYKHTFDVLNVLVKVSAKLSRQIYDAQQRDGYILLPRPSAIQAANDMKELSAGRLPNEKKGVGVGS